MDRTYGYTVESVIGHPLYLQLYEADHAPNQVQLLQLIEPIQASRPYKHPVWITTSFSLSVPVAFTHTARVMQSFCIFVHCTEPAMLRC